MHPGYPARVRRPSWLLLAVVLAGATAACGREPSDTDRVRDAVEGFGTATREKDVQAICDEFLSRRLVVQVEEAGLPCEVAWQRALSAAQAPSLAIRTVAVREDRALVGVRSTAANQKPSDDVLELVREGGDWRIAALAKPQPQPPARP